MLRDYQQEHYRRILSALASGHAALDASDTGTGKTYVALSVAAHLGVVPLVVGPKSARAGWEDAARALNLGIQFISYDKLRGRRVGWEIAPCPICKANGKQIFGPFRRRPTAETEWLREVRWGKGSYVEWVNTPVLIIFDEAHRCGGEKSLNAKALIAAKRQAEYVLCLSATAADDPRQMKALGFTLGLHGLNKKQPIDYVGFLLRHGCRPGVFGGFDFTTNPEKQKAAFTRLHGAIFPARGSRMRKSLIPSFPKTTVDVKLLSDETGKAEKLARELHGLNGELREGRIKPATLEESQRLRAGLELLKVPHLVDLTLDYSRSSKVVLFVNYTASREALVAGLRKEFGDARVGEIFGGQNDEDRRRVLSAFQANTLEALVGNTKAAGESANMHDPTGKVERTSLISPVESGRVYAQLLGRVNRLGAALSLQLIALFKDTYEEDLARLMRQRGMNIELFNDADCLV